MVRIIINKFKKLVRILAMKKMIVKGEQRLHGEVTIGGAKNSTVALIPAAI